ncbi:hypothetical protein Tco_0849541 [Tanacetum coccineum]
MSFKVDQQEVDVNLEVIHTVLQLPYATTDKKLVPLPEFEEIAYLLRSLNYYESKQPFIKIFAFQINCVSQLWKTFLTIINRCTTPKATSLDISRLCTLHILLGVVYMYHIDYTTLVWDDLILHVEGKGKNGNTNIAFVRYVKLVIEYFMLKHQHIARRINDERHTLEIDKPIQMINKSTATTKNVGMEIPNPTCSNDRCVEDEENSQDTLDKEINDYYEHEEKDQSWNRNDDDDDDDVDDENDSRGSQISTEFRKKKETPIPTPTRLNRTQSSHDYLCTSIPVSAYPTSSTTEIIQPPPQMEPTKIRMDEDKPPTPPADDHFIPSPPLKSGVTEIVKDDMETRLKLISDMAIQILKSKMAQNDKETSQEPSTARNEVPQEDKAKVPWEFMGMGERSNKRCGHNYVSVYVKRANNLRYTITEVDFSMMELDDIKFLYLEQPKDDEWKVALNDFMKGRALVKRVKDF